MPPERMEELFRQIVGNAGDEIALMGTLNTLRQEIPAPTTAKDNVDWKAKYEASVEEYKKAFYGAIKNTTQEDDHQTSDTPRSFEDLFVPGP